MKLFLQSDLHLEFAEALDPPPPDTEVLIWAGDIHHGVAVIEAAILQADRYGLEVVVVAGNHEFYYDDHDVVLNAMTEAAAAHPRVHFLENDSVALGAVRFFGATFWSDFSFQGPEAAAAARRASERTLPDYKIVTKEGTELSTAVTLGLHRESVAKLEQWLQEPHQGPSVVITHFAPHPQCDHPRHAGSPYTPYFISDQRRLMETYQPQLWCYGHTHDSMDFVHDKTRVISNQGGYPKEGGVRECYRDELNLIL